MTSTSEGLQRRLEGALEIIDNLIRDRDMLQQRLAAAEKVMDLARTHIRTQVRPLGFARLIDAYDAAKKD